MYPCKELHKIWKQWLAGYRWIYNWAIATMQKNPEKSKSAFSLQAEARNADRPEWVKALPGHQLQEAIADAFDAIKQAKANKGVAKFKSCRSRSQVIKFKVGNYKKGTWYSRLTKGLSFTSKQQIPQECNYGTQLVYKAGKWFACFPEHKEIIGTIQNKIIALDPGCRTFLTGYDGEAIIEVGENDIGMINRLCSHLDQLTSKIARSNSQRQRYKMRQAAGKLRVRIKNLVKDLHNKTANFLVNNYKVIFLPTFETSQMVLKQRRKIRSKTARNMLTWAHYRFAQNLIQMAARNNVLVVRCNESYTSKTCPSCGQIHEKLGSSKIFNCPNCNYKAPRDANGAFNIMLKALQATAFTIVGDAILLTDLGRDA